MADPAFKGLGLQTTPWDDRVEGLHPKDRQYHFVRGGRDLWIPGDVPLIPEPLMTERVLVEKDGHPWVEYDERDLGWRLFFGFVRYEERPASYVRILDITCPVTGKRTRAIYAHPKTIEMIRQVGRVVPKIDSFHGTPV